MGGLFYLTFSLNSSKTITFDIFLDLPLLNDEYEYFFEGEKGLGPTGPRFAPVSYIALAGRKKTLNPPTTQLFLMSLKSGENEMCV